MSLDELKERRSAIDAELSDIVAQLDAEETEERASTEELEAKSAELMEERQNILAEIENLGERFNIKEIAFDRWGATQISQTLMNMGFTLVGFGQGYVSMSPPTKEVERLVLNGRLRHGGHPVMRWMADNVMTTTDAAGNIKPDKSKSRQKIDGIVAGIMATDRALRHATEPPQSVYESRGLEVL